MLLTAANRVRVLVALLLIGGAATAAHGAPARWLIDLGPPPVPRSAPATAVGGSVLVAATRAQLAAGCDPRAGLAPGRDPYAETVLGRQRPAVTTTPAEQRLILAALLSQDPAFAEAQTASLRASADPALRYLGWLIPANVAARAPEPQAPLRGLLPGLAASADGIGFSTADVDYLEALAAIEAGAETAALDHLEAALTQEPDFFNARVLRLNLRLLALTRQADGGHRACRNGYAELFADLVALLDLSRCPLQAAQVELYLRRFLPAAEENPAFLAAQVYLAVIARRPELARHALTRFDAGSGPVCKRGLSRELHGVLGLADAPPAGGAR